MSGKSIAYYEGSDVSSVKRGWGIPTVQAFMARMPHILLKNKYIAEFTSGFWHQENGKLIKYMVSAVNMPQLVVESDPIYVGGAAVNMPSGFTQGNLEITVYNTGMELAAMFKWLQMTYNQQTRTYGYFDDVKTDMRLTQYTTDGRPVHEYTFTDCTIYQLGGIDFSYDPATAPMTFTVAMNYFGYILRTDANITKSIGDSDSIMEKSVKLANKKK